MVRVFVVVGQMYQTWRRTRAHHLHPSPSRTLLGNEQTAFSLGCVGEAKPLPVHYLRKALQSQVRLGRLGPVPIGIRRNANDRRET